MLANESGVFKKMKASMWNIPIVEMETQQLNHFKELKNIIQKKINDLNK